MNIQEILENHASELKHLGAEQIGLFGSFAAGTATEDSDVDIYVKLEESKRTFKQFNALYEYLESLFSRPIDLITDQSLSPRKAKLILPTVKYVALS